MNFDFNERSALARDAADAFERRRQEFIAAMRADPPVHMQQRRRELQFRIDMERACASTPIAAAVRLNSLPWSAFAGLRDATSDLIDRSATVEPRQREAPLLRVPPRS